MKTSKLLFVALLCLVLIAGGGLLSAQAHPGSANQFQLQNAPSAQATPTPAPQASPSPSPQARPGSPGKVEVEPEKPQHRLTQEEAKQLFQSLDELLHFASKNTLLPIKHPVKRAVVSREEVEKYIGDKFKNDVDRIRFERSALVLKKLGLLPRNFDLHTFMIKLLSEQVAGYYDEKSKTMNLLDWVEPDIQKSVMAHELTHALQDQSFDLEKMSKHDEEIEKKGLEDLDALIRNDEESTARSAVVEGQAMIVFIAYELATMGLNEKVLPDMVDRMESTMEGDNNDSPVFNSAPLLLKEELMFPYTKGTIFIKDLLVKGDKKMAFAGALEHLPTTTREILHPEEYIAGRRIPALLLPDVSFLKKDFEPYDAGAVGELDVDIMLKIYAGDKAADRLSPEWRGGSYYAAGLKGAKPSDPNSSAHVGLFYVSKWSTPAAAREFARLYADALSTRYKGLQRSASDNSRSGLQKFSSPDGPIFIQQTDSIVVAVESFSQADAEKLMDAGLKSARQQTLPPEQPPATTQSQ